MNLKYDMSAMVNGTNPIMGMINGLITETNFIFSYAFIAVIFIVSVSFIKIKTNDIGKGFVQGFYITNVLTIIMYYGMKVFDPTAQFIPDIIMYGMITFFGILLALIKFTRWNRGEQG